MVGDRVEEETHAARLEFRDQAPEFFFGSDLGIKLVVIDDVVSVLAAGARLQDGRSVTVADAELPKIRNQPARIFEVKVLIELQPVGRQRYRSALFAARRSKHSDSSEDGTVRTGELASIFWLDFRQSAAPLAQRYAVGCKWGLVWRVSGCSFT